jgi:hypothetical protein
MGRPGTVAFCLGRILTVHEGCFIWADRVLFTQTVVEPWAVSLFLVLSGPYRSPPIPLDHLKDLSKGISGGRGGKEPIEPSGPYRSPPIPLDHLNDLSKGISGGRGGEKSLSNLYLFYGRGLTGPPTGAPPNSLEPEKQRFKGICGAGGEGEWTQRVAGPSAG